MFVSSAHSVLTLSFRKLGFYLRRVAEKFRALFNWGAAHYLMLLSAHCMQVLLSNTSQKGLNILSITFFQFDLGTLMPETIASDGTCLLVRNDNGSCGAASATSSILLGSSGWMGLKHCIVKDLKTIATGMNDSYKMILYTLMNIRIFYASLQAEEQLKMYVQEIIRRALNRPESFSGTKSSMHLHRFLAFPCKCLLDCVLSRSLFLAICR